MRVVGIILGVSMLLIIRLSIYQRRKQRRMAGDRRGSRFVTDATPGSPTRRFRQALERSFGDVGTIAAREISERVRGRIFRVGTIVMLVGVGAAIVIPALHKGGGAGGPLRQTVGVIGALSPDARYLIDDAAARNDDAVKLLVEPSLAAARFDLRNGTTDFAIIDGGEVLLEEPATLSTSPADPSLVDTVADYLGVVRAYRASGLTASQALAVDKSRSVLVRTLEPGRKTTARSSSVIGLVLMFFLLTQYCTWILIGVMQEKSSRVVEVLLAIVRPLQLLGGKVIGIGFVALGQAGLLVGFAIGVGAAVGSNFLHGTATAMLLSELIWFVLGYAFYCWLYAAAGSMAERQDQVQTLALPLSIPILFGYIFSITVASTGNPDVFFRILAYVPVTAPFCMSVLVGLGDVTWWQFLASAAVSLASTIGMAFFAARIYRRAVLRTGGRVPLRELFARGAA